MLSNKNKQIYLQRLGFYCGLIDGIIGPESKKAIKEFKKKTCLSNDEIYDKKTDTELRKAYASWDGKRLSKHFKASEFSCPKYCSGMPKGKHMDPKLIGILEKLRADGGGKPIRITSGYRCKAYNRSLSGSSSTSLHMKRKAADCYIAGLSLSKAKSLAYKYGAKYSYYGTPNMGNCIHINV